MKKNLKKSNISGTKLAVAGAGLAAAAAGAYYFFGPNAKKHQKKAKLLMSKMKNDAMHEFKKAKKTGTPAYHRAVDKVSATYRKQYKLHEKDIKVLANRLKGDWQAVSKIAKKTAKNIKKGK